MATDWEVTSQEQRDELTDAGRFEASMVVNFRVIPTDTRGQIIVPMRLYTADYVRAQIDAFAERNKAIQAL